MRKSIIDSNINKSISKMHILGSGHIAMTMQSSDCDAIAIQIDEVFYSFEHIPGGENGDISIAQIPPEEFMSYCIKVDLSGGTYRLKKVTYEDGCIDMIVFQSETDHLHICSSEHNLIICKSIEDLSGPCYVDDDPSVLLA